MKKISIIALACISLYMASCSSDESVIVQDEQQQEEPQPESRVYNMWPEAGNLPVPATYTLATKTGNGEWIEHDPYQYVSIHNNDSVYFSTNGAYLENQNNGIQFEIFNKYPNHHIENYRYMILKYNASINEKFEVTFTEY